MSRFDGSLARPLDFGDATTTTGPLSSSGRAGLRLASPGGLLRGPDKYEVLDQRRRAAQIKARHAMDLIDVMERSAERR